MTQSNQSRAGALADAETLCFQAIPPTVYRVDAYRADVLVYGSCHEYRATVMPTMYFGAASHGLRHAGDAQALAAAVLGTGEWRFDVREVR